MTKTMLDVLKDRLIEGLTIKKVKETNSKFIVTFDYNEDELKGELSKYSAPDYHNQVADHTIITVMSEYYIKHGEYVKAKEWLDRISKV